MEERARVERERERERERKLERDDLMSPQRRPPLSVSSLAHAFPFPPSLLFPPPPTATSACHAPPSLAPLAPPPPSATATLPPFSLPLPSAPALSPSLAALAPSSLPSPSRLFAFPATFPPSPSQSPSPSPPTHGLPSPLAPSPFPVSRTPSFLALWFVGLVLREPVRALQSLMCRCICACE